MAGSTAEQVEAGMDAWMAWAAAAGDALVDWGVPTMPTSRDDPGPSGWIGGYSILPRVLRRLTPKARRPAASTGHPSAGARPC